MRGPLIAALCTLTSTLTCGPVALWWSPAPAPAAAGGVIEGTISVTGKASPVVVYVDGAGPPINGMPEGHVTEQGKQFTPSALVIRAGTTVDFENKDNVNHHVYSRSPGNDFEIPEYGHGARRSVLISNPGVVDVQCNIHPEMSTQLLALPNAWYATADATGAYRITGVEQGPHTVVAWAPGHRPERREITVIADGTVVVDAKLKRIPPPVQKL